jgi:hypothetical protein
MKYRSLFYGNADSGSFEISYILISRRIEHEFVLTEYDKSLVFETSSKKVELLGIIDILQYLNQYKYYFDFPEIKKWTY